MKLYAVAAVRSYKVIEGYRCHYKYHGPVVVEKPAALDFVGEDVPAVYTSLRNAKRALAALPKLGEYTIVEFDSGYTG